MTNQPEKHPTDAETGYCNICSDYSWRLTDCNHMDQPEKTEANEIKNVLESVVNEYTAGKYCNWAGQLNIEQAEAAIQRLLDTTRLETLERVGSENDDVTYSTPEGDEISVIDAIAAAKKRLGMK